MFRTELTIAPQERQLARTARVLTVGSCFADSIGERLRLNKVTALVNPFGTVFQPLALAQLLRAAGGEEQDWQQHVVEARGRWQSFDFHSTIGAESPVELLQLIQETVRRVGDFVRTADTVVLTLGTAWAYRLVETGELVSNLHKLPASLFEKELLTADEIVNGLAEVHALLRRANPNIRIVLTVSPVRHIKDSLPLNAVSKSVLRVACHYLSELLPDVSYFPAYELLTDELRDYRFYAADMLHPSEVAEDYIWDKFARAYFDADFGRFRKEWAAVRQALGHRPLHSGAPEHRLFLDQTRERLERMSVQGVDVRQELRDVQRQLAALPPPKPTKALEIEPDDDEERIDIGEGTSAAPTEPAVRSLVRRTESTAPQPEQRTDNRRDGRRGRDDRNRQDRRTGRPERVTVLPAEVEEQPAEALVVEVVTAPAETRPTIGEIDAPSIDANAAYPAKKKKRRSRGGAKRTARKHAARLATEQGGGLATEELTQELAHEVASILAEGSSEEVPVVLTVNGISLVTELNSATGGATDEQAAPAVEMPAVRKRGAGPTPKKSKVITKSGLVKRGSRGGLYRTPEQSETASPVAMASATAPIISPPIIPVALLERPAVAEAVEASIAAATSDPAPEASAPAARLRRGRSKATAVQPNAADVAVASPASGPTPPSDGEELRPKAAPRSAKSTKAAPKKPAAKKAPAKKAPSRPAAPRRRPPADTAPPAAETPAT